MCASLPSEAMNLACNRKRDLNCSWEEEEPLGWQIMALSGSCLLAQGSEEEQHGPENGGGVNLDSKDG